MGDANSPEQPIPKESGIPSSWTEIRNRYANSRYSEFYQIAMRRFREWEATPESTEVHTDLNEAVQEQIAKAKELPNTQMQTATIKDTSENEKISTFGKELPSYDSGKMTRVYIGTDPRKTADAYIALLHALENVGVLKDINASLNLEPLADPNDRKPRGNSLIIYDPMSRPEVLDKVLRAYKTARAKNPEAFYLTPRQRAMIMRENLRNFHATIDANVSFVEQLAFRKGGSFDTHERGAIQKAFGISVLRLSDQEWFEITQKLDTKGVVLSYDDEEKIKKGEIKTGDVLHSERRLSAPAIVQEGTIILR